MKKYGLTIMAATVFVLWAATVIAQTTLPQPDVLQQKLEQMQQRISKNEQQLRSYQWIESTSLAIDGRPQPATRSICSYATNGILLKTPLSSPEARSQHKGIFGGPFTKHIVQKKKEKIEEQLEEIRAVTQLYLPFDRVKFHQMLITGTIGLQHDPVYGNALVLTNYGKHGDQLRLALNGTDMQVDRVSIKTYFDTSGNAMRLDVRFSVLPDGTRYPALTSIDAPSMKLSIATVESDFTKPVF